MTRPTASGNQKRVTAQDFWMARARRVALRRNTATFLATFLPQMLVISGAAAALLLLLRTLRVEAEFVWPALAFAWLVAAAAAWFFSRGRWLRTDDALVRLDEVGQMHNRLTAARAGIGAWPEPREVREPVRWHWSRLLGPLTLAAMLLAGAAWLPVPETRQRERTREQPLAWTQLDSWIERLDEAKLVEQQALERVREQLNELREQPPDRWYDQSSLEAGDSLREHTDQSLQRMLQQLEKTEQTLAAAEKAKETSSPAQLNELSNALQNATQNLELGTLPLNKEMLNQLKNLDSAALKRVSPEQLAEMREKVRDGMRTAQQCLKPGANLKDAGLAQTDEGSGKGGGGGPAPLALRNDPTDLQTKETETIANTDPSQALPGDLVGIDQGKHDVDTTRALQQTAGGAISAAGEGGDAIRRESFTPREREVLQRFFK